ncbi:ABC transporter permease [Amorphus orientalis]|uniref:Phospholipid/cholesterol/gamma-HCH transport system permease protein n=1 Tax=Amorphus orientalis TaxID=649198 RepID=A0AAE4ATP4_9HYPH|nr:MlaE family lipid ABC transporter permease subunit [Amorphus orientalis]MDQ0316347.1 phospholipid/cholesterol/gamma-HCH transport system permease protein [Amorphus orientalis]
MNVQSAPGKARLTVDDADADMPTVSVSGFWTLKTARAAEDLVESVDLPNAQSVTIDLAGVEALDTAGTWLIHRLRARLEFRGIRVELVNVEERFESLFSEIEAHVPKQWKPRRRSVSLLNGLETVGRQTEEIARDAVSVISILGAFGIGLAAALFNPGRLRFTSILANFDRACRGAVPIVALMSFLIGLIIAQQGGFYLRQFGAETFVVDLVGVLVLREMGVLLTAIMVAGRSGSAYTAEIGSMKMREEIDALKVLGLDPVEILVIPRLMALMLALPLLAFIANIAALTGAAVVCWTYMSIPPEAFLQRLHQAVSIHELMVGLAKGPFMALIVGLIACSEGLKVGGSAESLGQQTTTSVVKAIFMVIVVDGLFAIFFSAMGI